MIDQDKRQAIYYLHNEGMSLREIARNMRVSVNTVSTIIRQQGVMPQTTRKDKISVDEALLRKVYKDCQGFKQRIHEILTEDHGISIGYSTLTRLIRELDLDNRKSNKRCGRFADLPGQEMQHDTTTYTLSVGGVRTKVVASIVYLRYSKIRYLKFYRHFNRFTMKCFLHEALMFWGYGARQCIIDNTNLARHYGTGRNAVIIPEMERFAAQYGFVFVCHEKGHANRKAGNERSFFTTETNFLPGRRFQSLEDLNAQAFSWATDRMMKRPLAKTGLIPMHLFDSEQPYLNKIPKFTPDPYLEHHRTCDQYGYIAFQGNYYWLPGEGRYGDVMVLEYSNYLKIYYQRRCLGEYKLPPATTRNERFWPKDRPPPKKRPHNRKKPTETEEKRLRALSDEVSNYIDELITPMNGKKRHGLIRQLYRLNQKVAPSLFQATIARALTYRVTDIEAIKRIATLQIRQGNWDIHYPVVDENYRSRKSYLDGQFVDDIDLSVYDEEGNHG